MRSFRRHLLSCTLVALLLLQVGAQGCPCCWKTTGDALLPNVTRSEWIVVADILGDAKHGSRIRVVRSIVGTRQPGEVLEVPDWVGHANEQVIVFGPKAIRFNGVPVDLEDEIRFLWTHSVGRYPEHRLLISDDSFSSRRDALRWVGAVSPGLSGAAGEYLAKHYDGRWLAPILVSSGALLAIAFLAWRRRFSLRVLLICVLLVSSLGLLPQAILGPQTASALTGQLHEARRCYGTSDDYGTADAQRCRLTSLLRATFALDRPSGERFLRNSVSDALGRLEREVDADGADRAGTLVSYLRFSLDTAHTLIESTGDRRLEDELTEEVGRVLHRLRGSNARNLACALSFPVNDWVDRPLSTLTLRWTEMADPEAIADSLLGASNDPVWLGLDLSRVNLLAAVEDVRRLGEQRPGIRKTLADFLERMRRYGDDSLCLELGLFGHRAAPAKSNPPAESEAASAPRCGAGQE